MKAEPRNRSEEEITDTEALATIHESYDHIRPRPGVILQLHRDLQFYSTGAVGGEFKNSDNVIARRMQKVIRRQGLSPSHGKLLKLWTLCDAFLKAWDEDRIDKLVLIPMFVWTFFAFILLMMETDA